MLRRSLVALAVVACVTVGLASARPPHESPDLSGDWQAAGWNTGVDPGAQPSYRGAVTLERRDHDTYLITWKIGARENHGVGLYDPRTNTFAGGYVIGQSPGVAIWQLSEDARSMDCVGTFKDKIGEVAHESWRRQ